MQIKNKKVIITAIFVLCFSFTSCSYGQNSKGVSNTQSKQGVKGTLNIDELLKKQILLTNHAQFSGDRKLDGASGFLIRYKNETFAVAARHLLGEAGGIQPEIAINDLEKNLSNWEMSPRISNDIKKQTIKLSAEGIDFSNSDNDIVLLKSTSNDPNLGTLVPNFEIPSPDEPLYLIGCPYSERQCRQNYYKVNFLEFYKAENLLLGEIFTDVNLAGFSGAPLVNGKGEVVGVLKGGGEDKGKYYISATPINEIQKMKF